MEKTSRPFLIVRVIAVVWILTVAVLSLAGSNFGGQGSHSIGNVTGKQRIVGTVKTQDLRDGKSQWTLGDLTVDSLPFDDRLLVFAPSSDGVESGDVVSVFCEVKPPQSIDGFRYDRLLASRDIYTTCFSNDVPTILLRAHPTVIDYLHRWREGIVRRIQSLYPPNAAALLSGLLIGTQTFSADWSATFRAAGISHIVAASGSNVEMVVTVLGTFLMVCGLPRRRSGIILGVGILAYMILAGAAAPVVRASILALLLLIARHLGRPSTASHLLLVTAAGMLFFQPLLLLYDVGFQLSILSTWALIVVAPRVHQQLVRLPLGEFGADLLASTLAITFVTAPLLLWTFGSISLVAIVANVFILPLVVPAMLFGTVSLAIPFVAFVARGILESILFLAQSFADLPYASLTFSYVDSFSSCTKHLVDSCRLRVAL